MSVIFPKWTNVLPTVIAIGAVGVLTSVVGGFWYYATPKFFRVGYMPTQPGGGFNHQIHAGKLGMDCRYCHTHVEESTEANIPNVATCYGCHKEGSLSLYNTSEAHKQKTEFIRQAYVADAPIEWVRIHKLPDYVRNFPHHVHLKAGVSCFSCHGQITAMPIVYEAEPLSMSWCLDCHRSPEKAVLEPEHRNKLTRLWWVEDHLARRASGETPISQSILQSLEKTPPPENCGACHY
ncbi:MAG TPA: cytochrome c3 family protein [Phycisphaerales bacterium]|nr:cytochrome c3 family protein [Phycisphaerales bacterium]